MAQSKKLLRYRLFENGIDSISHGIDHYIDGDKHKDGWNFKYAILHIFQGIELILKEKLYRINPILIYSKIDTRIDENSYTVSFNNLGIRLHNSGITLPEECIITLKEMQSIRNKVQHREFSLEIGQIKTIIGKTLEFLINFMRTELKDELSKHITSEKYEVIIDLIDFFDEKMRIANKKVQEHFRGLSPKECLEIEVLSCPYCLLETVVNEPDEKGFVTCYFCKELFYVDHCERCGTVVLRDRSDDDFVMCENCEEWMDEQ